MTQDQAKAELVTLLSDTLNQVSADRLTAAITQAWRDPYVATQVFDTTSTTFVTSVYQYPVPTGMSVVDAIYIQRSSANFPEEISAELWEVVDGNINFTKQAAYVVPTNYALQIRGKYKLAASDSIPADNVTMQNYVVTVAAWIVLKQIGFTKILSFLHNDTSISELVGFRNLIQQDMLNYRTQLVTTYVNN